MIIIKILRSTFLFFFIIGCSPKTTNVTTTPSASTEPISQSSSNLKTSEFDKFTYAVYKNGTYVETALEKKPVPIDGEEAFLQKMYRSIKYPQIARKNGVSGTCEIEVVLNEFGQLEDSKIRKDIGAGCGKESLKAVNIAFELPFEPATLDGKPVKVKFGIPVHFRLH